MSFAPLHEEPAATMAPPAPIAAAGRVRRVLMSRWTWGIATFIAFCVALVRLLHHLGGPEGIWDRFGYFAPAVSMPLHTMVALTPVPSDPLAIANGAIYGFWLGALFSWTSWFAAAMIEFYAARRLGRNWDVAAQIEKLPEWLRHVPIGHPVFLIGVRLVPLAGGHIGSILAGTMGVSAWRLAWCAAIAVLPGAFLTAAIGVGLARL